MNHGLNSLFKDFAAALILGLMGSAFLLLIATGWIWGNSFRREARLKKEALTLQTALETFHHQQGRYPDSLVEASISDSDKIYYQLEKGSSYILWHGTSLGESVIYHSTDKKWKD